MLISIDNLHDINRLYGIKNGDNVLEKVALWIASYLQTKKIENFPLGHIKGGDFILGLKGGMSEYSTLLELMCLKSNELTVGDIEVKLSGALSDTTHSKELDFLVENLFELQEQRKHSKEVSAELNMSPNELESSVINAINTRSLILMTQDVYSDKGVAFKECFVKLKSQDDKPIYPKAFTKVINRLGLSVDFDLLIVEEVLLHAQDNTIYALNISPSSLRNEKFLLKIKELMSTSKVKLMFVLSESEYFSHTSRFNTVISRVKEYGALVAVARLGSIHTSFLYLRELNIDYIRFDTYYSNEKKLKENYSIVEGFHLMAKEKKIKTWIKNIETDRAYTLAKKLGIEYIQGKELSGLEKIYEN